MFQQLLERRQPAPMQTFSSSDADDTPGTHTRSQPAKDDQDPSSHARRASDAWLPLDKELARAHRVASGRLEQEDIEWLCRGFSAFLGGGGRLSLQRCLRLPINEPAVQRAHRDHWLRRAWLLLD